MDAEEPLGVRRPASASVAIEIVEVLLPISASGRAAALIRASVSCLSDEDLGHRLLDEVDVADGLLDGFRGGDVRGDPLGGVLRGTGPAAA